MKRLFFILTAVLLAAMNVACCAEAGGTVNYPPRKGVGVEAVFAADDIQPYTEADGDQEKLDSIWIFYTDGTFEQFAEVDGEVILFSTGTHAFAGDADFVFENTDADNGQIIIRREKKYTSRGMEEYQSEHTYDLGTLGFTQLYAPDPGRGVAAVFYGCDKQPYVETDGDRETLDNWWIYYSDGTFEQFAILEDAPKDAVVLFSEGSYQLHEGSSFSYGENTGTGDSITIHRTKKLAQDHLAPYDSTHDYHLSTLGYVRIVAIEP